MSRRTAGPESSPSAAGRVYPLHVAVEARLTIAEAEAAEVLLVRLGDMVTRGVLTVPADVKETGPVAVRKLLEALQMRMEPWEGKA